MSFIKREVGKGEEEKKKRERKATDVRWKQKEADLKYGKVSILKQPN